MLIGDTILFIKKAVPYPDTTELPTTVGMETKSPVELLPQPPNTYKYMKTRCNIQETNSGEVHIKIRIPRADMIETSGGTDANSTHATGTDAGTCLIKALAF